MYVSKAIEGQPFHFRVWITNVTDKATDIAMVPLLDYRQSQLWNRCATVVHLEPKEEDTLESELRFDKPGIHQLQFIYIFDPYRSILKKEGALPFVEPSFRIGIKVEPSK
jgi:hypothetical protein